MTFDERADLGSVVPILSVGVRWGRAIGWVCKPEAAGSNPARSISENPHLQDFSRLGFHHRQQRCERGASEPPDSCRAQSNEVESGRLSVGAIYELGFGRLGESMQTTRAGWSPRTL